MYHRIEFRRKGVAEVESPGKARLEKVVIKPGTRLRAHLQPRVLETSQGPIEVADLYLEDGTVARAVRFAAFRFLDE